MRVITFYRLMVLLCAFLAAYTFLPTTSSANPAQKHICNAGINLGQAEARVYLFGRSFAGPIPAEQETAIATNLANASAEITAAEALFGEPFNSERSRNGIAASVISKISGFGSNASGSSYQHQSSYIRSIAETYRSSLAVTFVSSRPDAFQKNENCDSILFNLCYNYGRATIGSSFDPGWEYRGSAGLIPQLIRDGLAVAMDPGHKPYDGHHKKICCTFGSPAAWSAFPSFSGTSPYSLYSSSQSTLQGIIGSANALDPVCGSGDKYICPSSPYHKKQEGGKFAGRWRCSFGPKMTGRSTMTVAQDESSISGSYSSGGDTVTIKGTTTGDKMDISFGGQGILFNVTTNLSSDGGTMDGYMNTNQEGFHGPIKCSK